MLYIKRLPFILGVGATIIAGLFNYGKLGKEICIKLMITMIVFALIGFYLRNFFIKLLKEIEEKKRKEVLVSELEGSATLKEGEKADTGIASTSDQEGEISLLTQLQKSAGENVEGGLMARHTGTPGEEAAILSMLLNDEKKS